MASIVDSVTWLNRFPKQGAKGNHHRGRGDLSRRALCARPSLWSRAIGAWAPGRGTRAKESNGGVEWVRHAPGYKVSPLPILSPPSHPVSLSRAPLSLSLSLSLSLFRGHREGEIGLCSLPVHLCSSSGYSF